MKLKSFCLFICITFSGCSGKQMKKYGGELALNGGGHPIGAVVGVTVGGTLYGIGSLIEKDDNQKSINENKAQIFEKEDLEVKF